MEIDTFSHVHVQVRLPVSGVKRVSGCTTRD